MKNEFENTPKDLKRFYKQYLLKEASLKIIVIVPAPIVLVLSHNHYQMDSWKLILEVMGWIVFFSLLIYFVPLWISYRKIIIRRKNGEYFGMKKMFVSDDGVLFQYEDKSNLCQWNSIVKSGFVKDFIFLKLIENRLIIIPKSIFTDVLEINNFLGDVNSRIYGNPANVQYQKKKRKAPIILYFLTALCFIPFLGIIQGFIFLGLGIFKFKDKWFIIVAAIGLLIGSAVTLYIENILNNVCVKPGMKGIAEIELNETMRNLEIYKMHYGTYPESLKQLPSTNGMTFIYDPIQSDGKNNSENLIEFNYKKVDEKYILFSSGFDKIPNTADDIFPTLDKDSTRRYGRIMEPK